MSNDNLPPLPAWPAWGIASDGVRGFTDVQLNAYARAYGQACHEAGKRDAVAASGAGVPELLEALQDICCNVRSDQYAYKVAYDAIARHDAAAPTPDRATKAEAVSEPEFCTDPDGELCLDWQVGDARLSVSIGGTGLVSWAMLAGDVKGYGSKEFDTRAEAVPRNAGVELLAACKLALLAFETNAAIDWGILESAIALAEAPDLTESQMDAAIEAYDKAWNPGNRGRENKEEALRAAFKAFGSPDLGARDAAADWIAMQPLIGRGKGVVQCLYNDTPNVTDSVEAGDVIQSLTNYVVHALHPHNQLKSQPAPIAAPVEEVTDEQILGIAWGYEFGWAEHTNFTQFKADKDGAKPYLAFARAILAKSKGEGVQLDIAIDEAIAAIPAKGK